MIKKLLLTSGIIVFTWLSMFAQEATLQGKIIDKKTKEPISFANIVVENKGSQVGGTSSDFDGKYVIDHRCVSTMISQYISRSIQVF